MKGLKYILLAPVILILLAIGAQLAFALGTCIFLGFLILSGIQALLGVELNLDETAFFVISGIIGFLIFAVYYGAT